MRKSEFEHDQNQTAKNKFEPKQTNFRTLPEEKKTKKKNITAYELSV